MNKEFSDLNNLLTKIYPCFSSLLSPTSFPMSVIVSDFISDVSIEITKNLPTFSRLLSRVILRCRTPTRDVYLADKSDTNIKSRNSDFRDQTWVRHESAKWLFSDCNTNVSWDSMHAEYWHSPGQQGKVYSVQYACWILT